LWIDLDGLIVSLDGLSMNFSSSSSSTAIFDQMVDKHGRLQMELKTYGLAMHKDLIGATIALGCSKSLGRYVKHISILVEGDKLPGKYFEDPGLCPSGVSLTGCQPTSLCEFFRTCAKDVGYELSAQADPKNNLIAGNGIPNEPLLLGSQGYRPLRRCSWARP